MSSNTPTKQTGFPTPVRLILGFALAVGGFYVSKNVEIAALKDLAEKGISIDLGKTVATLGVLMMLFPVVRVFFIDPLATAISERNQDLEQTFTEAEQLRTQMQQMRSEYEQRLAATEAEARQRIEAQIKEAQSLRQTLMAEATQRADELVARAQSEIESERQRVLTSIRSQVVDLALTAAEKVIGENMDTERNRKLVDDFVAQVEVAR